MNKGIKITMTSISILVILAVIGLFYLNYQADQRFEEEKKYYSIYKEAKVLLNNGNSDEALKKYYSCLDSRDHGWSCEEGIYKIYRQRQGWERFVEFGLSRISQKEPPDMHDSSRWQMLGGVLLKELNDIDRAKQMYLKLDRWFTIAKVQMILARIYQQEGNVVAAEKHAEKALALLSRPGYHHSGLTKEDALKLLSEIQAVRVNEPNQNISKGVR